jgi:hypothetical protein
MAHREAGQATSLPQQRRIAEPLRRHGANVAGQIGLGKRSNGRHGPRFLFGGDAIAPAFRPATLAALFCRGTTVINL